MNNKSKKKKKVFGSQKKLNHWYKSNQKGLKKKKNGREKEGEKEWKSNLFALLDCWLYLSNNL